MQVIHFVCELGWVLSGRVGVVEGLEAIGKACTVCAQEWSVIQYCR